jgi:uncharacterized protein YecT (DUF1311 family)
MKMGRTVACLALALISAPAHAEILPPTLSPGSDEIVAMVADQYKKVVQDCGKGAQCLRSKVHDASETLAATYRGVVRANPKQTANLRATQEAWSKFVKANCEFLGLMANNSAEYQACMLHYIETRTYELHHYIGW